MRNLTRLQKEVAGALVGLARALDESNQSAGAFQVMTEGLRALNTAGEDELKQRLQAIHEEKRRAVPDCAVCQNPCGRTEDYNLDELDALAPPLPRLKYDLLDALIRRAEETRGTPEDFRPALEPLVEGLFAVGYDWFSPEEIIEKTGRL